MKIIYWENTRATRSMVSFEEVTMEVNDAPASSGNNVSSDQERAPWEERLLDAQEIMSVVANVVRPTARMQLEALGKRLQKESDALKRVQESRALADNDEKMEDTVSSATPTTNTPIPPPTVLPKAAAPPVISSSVKYVPVDRFAFDAGGYNDPFVTLYVDLPGVGSIPRDNVQCDFKATSIDLIVNDLQGKSYRLFKDSLEKDIDPSKSKIIVKANKVIVKLAKVKKEYGGFDYWSKLTDPKKLDTKKQKDDPQSSIMNMMKQMYDEGDDNMKKIIGETMMKQRNGELDKDKLGSGGLGGSSGLGGGGLGDDDMDDF
jgi:calcyclin binding protein